MVQPLYHLPEAFTGTPVPDVYVVFYTAPRNSRLNRIRFSHNLLCLVTHGIKEVYQQDKYVRCDPRHLFCVQSGSTLMSEHSGGDSPYQGILFFFSRDFITDFCLRHPVSLQVPPVRENTLTLYEKDDFLHHYTESLGMLAQYLMQDDSLRRTKLEEILLYLLQTQPLPTQAYIRSILRDKRDITFRQIIQQHLDSHLPLESLAFLCNMSLSTFKRKFAEVYHCPPGRYFMEHRMNRARQLLVAQKKPSEIYEELGYDSLSAFSAEFKKHFGVSPRSYSHAE